MRERVIVVLILIVKDFEYVGEWVEEGVTGRVVTTGVLEVVIEIDGLMVAEVDTVLVAIFVDGIGEGEIVIVELVHTVSEKILLLTLWDVVWL